MALPIIARVAAAASAGVKSYKAAKAAKGTGAAITKAPKKIPKNAIMNKPKEVASSGKKPKGMTEKGAMTVTPSPKPGFQGGTGAGKASGTGKGTPPRNTDSLAKRTKGRLRANKRAKGIK